MGAVVNVLDYKNIHFYEEHVKNGGVAGRFGLALLENGYKGNYRCHCCLLDTSPTAKEMDVLP